MDDEAVMKYIISTHNDKPISTDGIYHRHNSRQSKQRYNIGDEVWTAFCKNGVVETVKCRITDFEVNQYGSHRFIKYGLIAITENTSGCEISEYEIPDKYYEEYLFPTKEELLKS